jgi:hypothetical protein
MEYSNPDLPEEAKTALSEIEKQFIAMRSSGLPIRKIAKSLNKSTRTIYKWNKKFYRNIVEINSEEFKELRNKIIRFKNTRLDFLIEEFKNVRDAMTKSELLYKKSHWDYEGYLETLLKISKLVDKFESDLLVPTANLQKIDESQIIDAENEEIELIPEENISPEQMKTDNNEAISEENNVVPEQNDVVPEDNDVVPKQNNVVPEQNGNTNNSSEHIDNT